MANPVPQKIELAATTAYVRDSYVAAYAKILAKGDCDLCTKPAPFLTVNAEPYLESHHVTWLSRGGYDLIDNVVALCPNCHRKMHSRDEEADREHLLYRISSRHQL
ncbi:MAG: HNH endonuclease signature motif containing protein [Chlorobium sp.]